MRLRTKFVLILVAVLVVLSAVNVGVLLFQRQQAVERTRTNVDGTARRIAETIDKDIEARQSRLNRIATKHPGENLSDPPQLLWSFFNATRYWKLEVVAANGTVMSVVGQLGAVQRDRYLGRNVASQEYFRRAMDGGRGVSDPVAPSQLPGRTFPSVTLSAPIVDPDTAEIVGVLTASITLTTQFFSMVGPLESVDKRKVSVAGGGLVLDGTAGKFENNVSSTATVENAGWTVTVTQNREILDERLRQLAVLQGLSLLLVFGAVVGFGFWEYRANLSQTEQLLDGFERIRGGDYDSRLEMANSEEWRQISEGFNDLARGLATREAQLREREQRLSVLNRVLRHNLRNEMSVILNYAEVIRELAESEPPREAADTILDTGRKLADLSEKARQIEEAIDAAEAGLVEQDLAEILDKVLDELRGEYPDADVRLHAPDEQPVAGIQSLWIAVRNVCENALEHNDAEEPRVVIDVEPHERDGDRRVFVRVADNGPGIPDQEKAVLTQGRETALEHGSGLGLWLVYWIVDKSDGNLRFDENEPRGSVVTMDLHASVPEDVTPSSPAVEVDAEDDDLRD